MCVFLCVFNLAGAGNWLMWKRYAIILLGCWFIEREGMGLWSEWHYTTREIGGWIHIITSPSGQVIICIHTPIPELFAMSSKCVSDVMVKQWKMKSWTVTMVIMWLLCDHGVEASKDWVFVAHFIHLFNTTMPMPCTDVHSGVPMSHLFHRRVRMGCQDLNYLSRGNYVFKMSRMHACLQNVQPLYNTFNAPALWKPSQVWVSSGARQERPGMFFNFTKIILVNIWILN